jgi:hypothetical protein
LRPTILSARIAPVTSFHATSTAITAQSRIEEVSG